MAPPSLPRALLAALVLAGGAAFALVSGAPLEPVLVALFAGVGAALIAASASPPPERPAPAAAERAPRRPSVRDLIDSFSEPVLIVRHRRVVLGNAAARAVLGAGIEGEDVRLAIRHPIAAERLIAPLASADPASVELLGLGEAGRRWTMTVAPLADGARLVRLEDRSAAWATEKMRTDFVANASHELRTPLATILGIVETLEDLNDGDERDTRMRFLTIMHGEARRMGRLVDDLISLSRIEAERFTAPREAHDLAALVAQASDELRHLSAKRDSPVLLDAPGALPPVAGDRPQLLQMIDNLIANAIRYGRPGTPVRVGVAPGEDGMLVLTVTDAGEGIAREHLPRITERFYRVDPGRSRAAGGTGLGLSIVKHVVERHRGRLAFASEVGRGTTVTVTLPTEPAALSSKSHRAVTDPPGGAASATASPG